jgi:DNA-directed RNA polymerase specialized sigma24 family protein
MYASKKDSVDATSLASLWGPRLLRFYYLLCANQALAESLAIETLSEIIRAGRWTKPAVLVRLALTKAVALPCGSPSGEDRIAWAIASLPRSQGFVVALVRGMGLEIGDVAEATQTSVSESKRRFADGVVELHRLLFSNQVTVGDVK